MTVKKSRREKDSISGASATKTGRFSNPGCALFSLPFFLAGAAMLYFLGLSPVLKVLRASTWDATSCLITTSRVASSSDGDTFAVEIHYTYAAGGIGYKGTRYGFISAYSSGYDSKDEIVKQNPVGKTAVC